MIKGTNVDNEQVDLYKDIKEAFEPFRYALQKNETDTIGAMSRNNLVLFETGGCWTGEASVTLGNLRNLAALIAKL